jgi:hypothetical protein
MRGLKESLDCVERDAMVRGSILEAKNQLDVLEPAGKARIDGVQSVGKVKGCLSSLDPTPGGTEKLVVSDVTHEKLARQYVIRLHVLNLHGPVMAANQAEPQSCPKAEGETRS